MTELKETVTTRKDVGIDQTSAPVAQQTRHVNTQVANDGRKTAANVIWFIVGLISTLLAFRFILKLLGANPASGFVDFIYSVTGILTAPFDNIFNVVTADAGQVQSVFEPSIIVAALVYALLGWGIVKVLNLNRAQ